MASQNVSSPRIRKITLTKRKISQIDRIDHKMLKENIEVDKTGPFKKDRKQFEEYKTSPNTNLKLSLQNSKHLNRGKDLQGLRFSVATKENSKEAFGYEENKSKKSVDSSYLCAVRIKKELPSDLIKNYNKEPPGKKTSEKVKIADNKSKKSVDSSNLCAVRIKEELSSDRIKNYTKDPHGKKANEKVRIAKKTRNIESNDDITGNTEDMLKEQKEFVKKNNDKLAYLKWQKRLGCSPFVRRRRSSRIAKLDKICYSEKYLTKRLF